MTAIRSAISVMGFIDSSFCQGKCDLLLTQNIKHFRHNTKGNIDQVFDDFSKCSGNPPRL